MWNPSLLSLVLLNFKKIYTAAFFFFFFCLQHTLLSWSSDGPHPGVSFVETGSMSLSLVSSTECRINFINWESIELTRKFVRVFLQPLMEKPKWTFWPTQYFGLIKPNMLLEAFGDSSLLPWVDVCGGDFPWYPAHFQIGELILQVDSCCWLLCLRSLPFSPLFCAAEADSWDLHQYALLDGFSQWRALIGDWRKKIFIPGFRYLFL